MTQRFAIFFTALLVLVSDGLAQDFTTVVSTPPPGPSTPQQLLAATALEFEKRLVLDKAKVNSVLSALKSLQSIDADVAVKIGPAITNDFYLEGTAAIDGMAEFITRDDPFLANIGRNVYNSYPNETEFEYRRCAATNVAANALPALITGVSQVVTKSLTAEASFKTESTKCLTVAANQVAGCLTTAMNNNLPQVSNNIVNTKSLVDKMYACFFAAAERLKRLGYLSITGFTEALNNQLDFLVPPSFDPKNKTFPVVPDYTNPSERLNELTQLLAEAKRVTAEAVNGKAATLVSTRSFLEPLLNESLANLEKLSVQATATGCLVVAKLSVTTNFNGRAQEILQCLWGVTAPPTLADIAAVETALLDRKAKEDLQLPWVQCSATTRNAFDGGKLQCCISEAEDDYKFFLAGVKATLQTTIRKSSDVKALLNLCASNGQTAFQKQLNTDLIVLDKCLKKNSKIVVNPPSGTT